MDYLLETPCRVWRGKRNKLGYGVHYVRSGALPVRSEDGRFVRWEGGRGRKVFVHRWVWEEIHGPIPDGMVICHKCDNPPCYRLDHLFLGTQADNLGDMRAKGKGRRSSHPAEVIEQIRARLAAGEKGKTLAAEYGVCPSTISNYQYGRTRGHYPPPSRSL